jgi:hypothetical protein
VFVLQQTPDPDIDNDPILAGGDSFTFEVFRRVNLCVCSAEDVLIRGFPFGKYRQTDKLPACFERRQEISPIELP